MPPKTPMIPQRRAAGRLGIVQAPSLVHPHLRTSVANDAEHGIAADRPAVAGPRPRSRERRARQP